MLIISTSNECMRLIDTLLYFFISWVAVVTPTDRPKSVRNRCIIDIFVALFVLSLYPFDNFVGIGNFVVALSQISSFFSLHSQIQVGPTGRVWYGPSGLLQHHRYVDYRLEWTMFPSRYRLSCRNVGKLLQDGRHAGMNKLLWGNMVTSLSSKRQWYYISFPLTTPPVKVKDQKKDFDHSTAIPHYCWDTSMTIAKNGYMNDAD